ncbi:zinc finger protein ZAT12-like [Nicotiana tomentosiformis]|uniref:zinc finger protein ZAT12-like n=1 Tax=Nicotiana tomentosiformis TaxID=4098 RepID=UPI00051C018F|nr:zinc finger protein ZAT12-like [Nicotiana tomentosiformis]
MVFLPTKREREEEDFHSIKTMANCLMLFSNQSNDYHFDNIMKYNNSTTNRVFECKTCNRQFSSFQALGGHRASHKKPRLNMRELNNLQLFQLPSIKPKTHECSICGLEFALGQALGGHMRRHRVVITTTTTTTTAEAQSQTSWTRLNEFSRHQALMNNENLDQAPNRRVPVVKKLNGQRVLCLDLNLTPLENDHLEFNLGADCFL